MTDAVASASGQSSAQAIGAIHGYEVSWARLSYPYAQESGYQCSWVRICHPYAPGTGYQCSWIGIKMPYATLTLLQGGSGDGAKAKRPIVDDRNDLQDLCEIWELMMRKAA